MKKTLIALAVLAASGASFAQVSITGAVAMGWAGSTDAAGNQSSGLGVDTATIDFGVKEALGGGMTVEAHQGFDTLARSGVTGGDTTMKLSTASGLALTLGATQLADYLQGGIANVSSAFNGWEGRMVGNKAVGTDWASVAFPVGPVTLSVTKYEPSTAWSTTTGALAGGLGLGAGSAGNGGAQANMQYQVAYAAGALAANAAYKSYDNAGTAATANKSIVRGSVSYDFGAAKVGGGISAASRNTGTDTESMLSVGVPFGSVLLGANYFNRNVNGTAADFNQSGYALELDYSLSKSTKFVVSYLNWQQAPGVVSNSTGAAATAYSGSSSNLTEFALVKSF